MIDKHFHVRISEQNSLPLIDTPSKAYAEYERILKSFECCVDKKSTYLNIEHQLRGFIYRLIVDGLIHADIPRISVDSVGMFGFNGIVILCDGEHSSLWIQRKLGYDPYSNNAQKFIGNLIG